jgi:gluconolactonase
MGAMEPEVSLQAFDVYSSGLDHPECCAFDKSGILWAGGEAGQIYRIDRAGRVEQIAHLGGFCAGLAFSANDELFVCNPALGVVWVKRTGQWTIFAESAGGKRFGEPNFPVFDIRGNLYVTDSGEWRRAIGRLLRFDTQGTGVELVTGCGYANGLALSADERYIYLAESDTDTVYRIELLDGGLAARAPEVYARPIGHAPDGLCLDSEGNLYVTSYGSHEILRVTPQREIHLFGRDPNGMIIGGPTNLTFGGPDYKEVYVANFGRRTIVRARTERMGLPPVNLRDTNQKRVSCMLRSQSH